MGVRQVDDGGEGALFSSAGRVRVLAIHVAVHHADAQLPLEQVQDLVIGRGEPPQPGVVVGTRTALILRLLLRLLL